MSTLSKSSSFLRGALALTVALGCGSVAVNAQTTNDTGTASSTTLNTALPAYSSSADESVAPANTNLALNVKPFNFVNAMQYGSGGRSGAPRYRGGNTNADGSNRWVFEAGVGLTVPVQDTSTYLKPSYALGGGFGRQWSKRFAALLQFDWDNFGFQNSTLTNQLALYNKFIGYCNTSTACDGGTPIPTIASLGGSSHVWSFTVNPMYTIKSGEGLGVYVVGGAGFYHKTANFTTPSSGVYCDPYYGICYNYTANATIDKYTSNAPGFSGGLGLTYKFSRFSNEQFFLEGRYEYVVNSQKSGLTNATITAANYASTSNDYPANSDRTSYFPVKIGIRF
jgi:hypothetical protein